MIFPRRVVVLILSINSDEHIDSLRGRRDQGQRYGDDSDLEIFLYISELSFEVIHWVIIYLMSYL
jgi:hypothetical protein